MMIMAATTQTLGHDIEEIAISRGLIRCFG